MWKSNLHVFYWDLKFVGVYKGKLKQIILDNINSHSGIAEKLGV